MRSCINCGKEIPTDSLFCSYCGSKQLANEPVETEIAVTDNVSATETFDNALSVTSQRTIKKAKAGIRVATIIRNSVIMALAVFLLIAAFFPISNVSLKDNNIIAEYDIDAEISLNTFQYITLFFDSFADVEDMDDLSDFEEQINEIAEEFHNFDDDFENLTRKEKNLFNEMVYIMLRTTIQLDKSGPYASIIFSCILGILNIIISVSLFVVALLNLLATFNLIKKGKAQLYKWTVALITASPAVILAAYYTGSLCIGKGMSSVAILSLVCSFAAATMLMVLRYIFSNKDTIRNIVSRSIALAMSIVIFCLAFAPVFSASFKSIEYGETRSRNVKVSHGADFFQSLVISDEEMEDIKYVRNMSKTAKKQYFENKLKDFSYMTKKEIESGYGANVNSGILVSLLGSKIATPILDLFSITVLLFIFAVVGAMLVFWQGLYFFATGKHIKVVVLIAKIITVIVSAAAMIMAIVFVANASYYANQYISSSYHVTISAGIIVMTVFAIGAIFCPGSLTKKIKKVKPTRTQQTYEDFQGQF